VSLKFFLNHFPQKISVETIKTVNLDLAALHGYLCADGYVISHKKDSKRKYYRMALRNTEKVLLEDFQSKFYNVFGLTPKIPTALDIAYKSSKETYFLLTNTFGSFYCREWAFPEIFITLELKAIWLRSVFDCEGWVIVRVAVDRRIGIEMVNFKGLNKIKSLLLEFGIKSRFHIRKNGRIFALYIFGKENLVKFSKKIGFLHPKKKVKLKEAINSFQNPVWAFPTKELLLKKFILKKLKGKSGKIGENKIIVCSSLRINLEKLQPRLIELYKVKPLVSKKNFNGIGTPYFQLSINRKEDVQKINFLVNL